MLDTVKVACANTGLNPNSKG